MFGGIGARSRSDDPDEWDVARSGRKHRLEFGGSATRLAGLRRVHQLAASSDELSAWSVYRQNLSSDLTDSALGSSAKSPLPRDNFQLRDSGALLPARSRLGADIHSYLKHGLPRALPPPPADASSGYDSSEGEAVRRRHRRRRRRAASQPDLRAGGSRRLLDDSVLSELDRCRSAADLLSESADSDGGALRHRRRRRPPASRPHCSAGFASGRQPPMLNGRLFPADQRVDAHQPHLQVRRLGCQRRAAAGWQPLLQHVSFEARAGDLVGVLTASEEEGTALLDVLADCSCRGQLRISGDLTMNGCTVSPARLACRLAYVQRDHNLCGNMSVRQTLLFHAFLQQPGHVARGFNIKAKIGALMDDLGLGQVKHTPVRQLTDSERCRLLVACQLCLETDLVLLDRPAQHMDVFDTFFLLEYLRQWAARGRIVLLTLQPPSHDIFCLLSRLLLISQQRVVYSGRRCDMLCYFATIGYPCPTYKNPSDYFLDLVTLDALSPEARLESTQRVVELAEACERQQTRLPQPVTAGLLPPRVRRAACWVQLFGLTVRAVVYKFPQNVMELAGRLVAACLLSLIVGAVFINIRGENMDQESVPDRVGFHYFMLSLAVWPTLLFSVSAIWREKDVISRDVGDRLYSPVCHAASEIALGLPAAALECLLLIGPAHKMAGSQSSDTDTTFYVYTGYMLAYVLCVRLMAVAAALGSSSRQLAAGWLAATLVPPLLAAGWSVHPHQLSPWTGWLRWVSAPAWLYQRLVWNELAHVRSLRCSRNPVVAKGATILVQVECGLARGDQALLFLAVEDERTPLLPLLVTAATALLAALLAVLAAMLVRQRRHRPRPSSARVP